MSDKYDNVQETPIVKTEANETENIIVELQDNNSIKTTTISDIDVKQKTYEVKEIEKDVTEVETIQSIDSSVKEEIQNESTTQNVRVNTKALNIRKSPDKNSDIVTIVYEDELLILSETNSINGFYKIVTYTGIEGYCMEQFVELV